MIKLSVHLENGERVFWREGENLARRAEEPPKPTTLTSFFTLCQRDEFARTLLYNEVPTYYTWSDSGKDWKRRVRGSPVQGHPGVVSDEALGRVYTVHPINAEAFYLRLLLHSVRGPTSFETLKTVRGQMCNSFAEACKRLGLVEDDAQWIMTMR